MSVSSTVCWLVILRFVGTIIALLWFDGTAQAIVTSDALGSHVAQPDQLAFGIDLSGVVMIGGLKLNGAPASTCSGVLITDRHVLSAAHCFDSNINGLVDADLGLFPHQAVFESSTGYTAVTYELESIQWLPDWPANRDDLAVITLIDDAPHWALRSPIYAGEHEIGKPFILAGYGYSGYGEIGTQSVDSVPTKRAGRNRYEYLNIEYSGVDFLSYDFDSGLPEHNALQVMDVESDLGFGPDEVNSAFGDSGGPVFINGAIAGITSWGRRVSESDATEELDSSWGELTFDTRVSIFRKFIEGATDGQALFVFDGDYTKDGSVEGHDFLLWQRQYGADDFPAADGDGDGTVSEADYELWLDNFGRSTGTSASHAVPEPAAAILLLGSFLSLLFVRRRRVVCR